MADPSDGDSPLFPTGFGHYDRPAPPPADPTAEPLRPEVPRKFEEHGADFPDLGEQVDPLTADELYSDPSYTFEVTLSDRVLTGELHLIEAFDHPDCASAARDDETRQALSTCEYRIEAAYEAGYEGVRVSQQVLMFADEAGAESFAGLIEEEFAGDVLSFAHMPDFEDFSKDQYAASRLGTEGVFVVLTVMVSESDDKESIEAAEEHAHVRHAESLSYFIWR